MFDANGNVTDYVDATGAIVAHREYGPFGKTTALSGPMQNAFTHWWSTKPWDPITGFSEYEYRMYSPELGRWLSRDPIEEHGGINLFAACHNAAIEEVDYQGQNLIAALAWGAVKQCTRSFMESVVMRELARQIKMNEALRFLIETGETGGFRELRHNRWVVETDDISPIGRSGISAPSRLRWIRRCLTSFGKKRFVENIRDRYPDLPIEQLWDAAERAVGMLSDASQSLDVDVRYYVFYSCIPCDRNGHRGFEYRVNTRVSVDAGTGSVYTEWNLGSPYGRHGVPRSHMLYPQFDTWVCPQE
jgi:RHS repeat-associated protein